MLKKTVTYTDFNDVERTEDFYFHLTKAKLIEMETGTVGGLSEKIQKIIDSKETGKIIELFKTLLLVSYGEKSEDGRSFIQDEETSKKFSQTAAYSELFMSLATDEKAAADFVNGILPADLAKEAKKEMAKLEKKEK